MGDFMKKGIFEWGILIWTSLLVLLITGWVMIEFYNWKDTIVAAIIAFVGAIIGGAITYLGVVKNLKETKKESYLKEIPAKLFNLSIVESKFELIYLKYVIYPFEKEKILEYLIAIQEMIIVEGLIEKAILVDYTLFEKIKNINFLCDYYEGLVSYAIDNDEERKDFSQISMDIHNRFKLIRIETEKIRKELYKELKGEFLELEV